MTSANLVEKVKNLCQNVDAFLGIDRRFVERPRLLQHGCLLQILERIAISYENKYFVSELQSGSLETR